jgi:hypothetical protein
VLLENLGIRAGDENPAAPVLQILEATLERVYFLFCKEILCEMNSVIDSLTGNSS